MKKELTENESIAIDYALKKYLDLHPSGQTVFKAVFPFFVKEIITEEKRIKFIITELSVLNILSYKNERGDETLVHKFNREEIIELLKNGGMTAKWLEKESKRVNLKLINKTLKDYYWTKWISIISFAIGIVLSIVEITKWVNS